MHTYDFELVKDAAVVTARRAITLPDIAAAWPLIARLARAVTEPGVKIRVRGVTGGIVIQTGVASVRHLAEPLIAA